MLYNFKRTNTKKNNFYALANFDRFAVLWYLRVLYKRGNNACNDFGEMKIIKNVCIFYAHIFKNVL